MSDDQVKEEVDRKRFVLEIAVPDVGTVIFWRDAKDANAAWGVRGSATLGQFLNAVLNREVLDIKRFVETSLTRTEEM